VYGQTFSVKNIFAVTQYKMEYWNCSMWNCLEEMKNLYWKIL